MVKINIIWTQHAMDDVEKIYQFYCDIASIKVAKKIIEPFFSAVKKLEKGKSIGQEEESLKILKRGHRYLICGHNKIIYLPTLEAIFITHVFDTRQNPNKLF
jgi:toxin ParE1/3/4